MAEISGIITVFSICLWFGLKNEMELLVYKDDITPLEAMEKLRSSPDAVLLDVRTLPEWKYVGVPAVEPLLAVEWQFFPDDAPNPLFIMQVEQAGVPKSAEILVICRSGVRSIDAAKALAAAGFKKTYNVTEGFEGDKNAEGHRSSIGGWKFHGLPWRQK